MCSLPLEAPHLEVGGGGEGQEGAESSSVEPRGWLFGWLAGWLAASMHVEERERERGPG